MNFHTFGDRERPVIVLIHGVLTPWQVWERQIEYFEKEYYVVAVALDAHEEERSSEFVSIDDEARKIEDYILQNHGGEVYAICGISMGGAITHIIWKNRRIKAQKYVLDGAPLVPFGKLMCWVMTHNYINIIIKSKQRDKRILNSFKKNFLPERFLDTYLKIADNMRESSVRNMITSVCGSNVCTDVESDGAEVMFLHGTKGNESLAKKSAALVKKHYLKCMVVCFDGFKHCEAAIYKQEKWLRYVEEFFER